MDRAAAIWAAVRLEDESEEENNGFIFYSVLTIALIASIAAGFKIYKNISK